MSKALNKTDLGYLGVDYQYQIVKCFIEEPKFFQEINSIVNQNMFTVQNLRTIVGTIKDYYKKYGLIPSYSLLKTLLCEKSRTETDREEYIDELNKLSSASSEGREYTLENATKFFKQQNMIRVANEIIKIAGNGDTDRYEECKKLLDEALIVGDTDEMGCSPYDLLEEAMQDDYKCPVTTGISKLDEALNGGLEKGKIGLIIGSAGFGKSTLSTAIASAASTYRCDLNNNAGFKVLQIYFEDDSVDIARKHFSRITNVEARNLTSDPSQIEQIRSTIENFKDKELMKDNLRLKRFNTNTKSATDIENFIKKQINSGFKPDLVIIDYFECLLPEKTGYSTDSEWTREGTTMRKIENMAKDLDIAIWVPTQGNKGSINSPDVVTMDQAGGSIKKVQVAQVVISIARSLDDIDNSRATLAILKNRSGKSGQVFKDIKFDNGRSIISCDDVIEYNNANAYHEDMKMIESEQLTQLARDLNRQNELNSAQEF